MSERKQAWSVRDVMAEDVITASPDTPYKVLVEQLLFGCVSGLPVVAEGRVVGMVSESDLLIKEEQAPGSSVLQWTRHLAELATGHDSAAVDRTLAELSRALGRTAADLMTSPAITIGPGAGLAEAAQLMRRHDLKRLPVVDERGRLVGIVSRADLLRVFMQTDAQIEQAVHEVLDLVLNEPDAVSVTVREGVVTLDGEVEADPEVEAAVMRVEMLPGVVSVDEHLRAAV